MLDFDNMAVEIACPRCGYYEQTTLGEMRLDGVIICGGCKVNIRFRDYRGELSTALETFDKALNSLQRSITFTLRF